MSHPLSPFRKNFWRHFADLHPGVEEEVHGKLGANSYIWLRSGHSDLFVGLGVGKSQAGFYLRGHRGSANTDVYNLVEPFAADLESATGNKLKPHRHGHYCGEDRPFDLEDRGNWDEAAEWLRDRASVCRCVLSASSEGES